VEEHADLDQRLSSYYVGDSGARYAEWQIAYARASAYVVSRRLQKHIAPTAVVVDFGCGGGEMLSQLRCARRIGIEPNEAAFDVCKERGVEAYRSTADLPDSLADIVLSNHVLEHCKRPLDELQELARILAPSGKLILVVPINDWRNDRRYRPNELSHHLYTWTPLTLGHLLSEAGFLVDRIQITSDARPPRRFYKRWISWPEWTFERVCDALGILLRNRQIVAICEKPGSTVIRPDSNG
jgi:SAM-dependent methyltransferase